MSNGILDRAAVEDRREAQRSITARIEQIRDDCETLLDPDQEPDVNEIDGVIFGVSDGNLAEARATQRPGSDPPAPLLCILGELIDAFAHSTGREREQIAAHVLQIMRASQDTDQYEQSYSGSREGEQ